MPVQRALAEEKEGEGSTPVTQRHLSLDDLLSQCKHYSGNVRRDAFAGIRELALRYPDLPVPNFGRVFGVIVAAIVDEDAIARSGLLATFQTLLPLIPAPVFTPFVKLYMVIARDGHNCGVAQRKLTHVRVSVGLRDDGHVTYEP